MKKIINQFRGTAVLRVVCDNPVRFINSCAAEDLEFWDIRKPDDRTVEMSIHRGDLGSFRRMGESAAAELSVISRTGLPHFLWTLRKRYVLLAGLLLCIAVLTVSSLFIWEITVTGNENVKTADIMAALDDLGIGVGTFSPKLLSIDVSTKMMLEIPELSFIAVNVNGCRAEVIVRERTEIPEIVDEDAPSVVYAVKPGVISDMSVLNGNAVCTEGSTVAEGDILVTGILDSMPGDRRLVHAMGDVYARTWYEDSLQMCVNASGKEYTGEVKKKIALILAGKRINLYFDGGIDMENYDKITSKENVTLFSTILPLSIVTEEYSEYNKTECVLNREKAEQVMRQRLEDSITSKIDGEITDIEFVTYEDNGMLIVTARAECLEQIGKVRNLTQEEIESQTIQAGEN